MSRYDYPDPGLDPDYCDPLTPEPEDDTHYVPAFTRVNNKGQQEAVCAQFIDQDQFSVEPTCPACRAWLGVA